MDRPDLHQVLARDWWENDTVGDLINCQESQLTMSTWYHISVAPATLILFILGLLHKRTYTCTKCCWGRPGAVVPLNFLDDFDNRWTYAAAFGAITNIIVGIFSGFGANTMDYPAPVYLKGLIAIASALEISWNFSPLFACLCTDYKLTGSIMGFIYSSLWMAVKWMSLLDCIDPIPKIFPNATLWTELPTLFCLTFVALRFLRNIGENTKNQTWTMEKIHKPIAPGHHVLYVKDLLNRRGLPTIKYDLHWYEMIWSKLVDIYKHYIYNADLPFKYSSRIMCTMFVIFMCNYQLGCMNFWISSVFLFDLRVIFNDLNNATNIKIFNTSLADTTDTIFDMILYSWLVPTIIVSLYFALGVFVIVANYRLNMLDLYKGDRSFMPTKFELSSTMVTSSTLKYGGYQIAYVLWGNIFVSAICVLFSLVICFVVILPLMLGTDSILMFLIEIVISPAIISMVVYYGQIVLAKYCFLQDKLNKDDPDQPLALTNRLHFNIMDYYMFIVNVSTGLFSSLSRILRGLIYGLMYIGRMDRCVLMSGFEDKDRGYISYIGMLLLEEAHNHPVLRVFCQILHDTFPEYGQSTREFNLKNRKFKNSDSKTNITFYGATETNISVIDMKENIQADYTNRERLRRRWRVLYTLIRNPELVPLRKSNLARNKKDEEEDFATKVYEKFKLEMHEHQEKQNKKKEMKKLEKLEQKNKKTKKVKHHLSDDGEGNDDTQSETGESLNFVKDFNILKQEDHDDIKKDKKIDIDEDPGGIYQLDREKTSISIVQVKPVGSPTVNLFYDNDDTYTTEL